MDDFFGQPQGAAVLKHEVLRKYVPVYARKTGSKTSVVLLDGYAGPGRYDDGSSGSPELMVGTAQALRGSRVHCAFVEENPRHCERLQTLLADLGDHDSEVFAGDIEQHLGAIVRNSRGKALLVLLDPFGLSIPFNLLSETILHRRRFGQEWQPTEVLLNFSINGINRSAGRLDSSPESPSAAKANETRLRELEDFLGGGWWKPIWRSGAANRVEQIFERYLQQIRTYRVWVEDLGRPSCGSVGWTSSILPCVVHAEQARALVLRQRRFLWGRRVTRLYLPKRPTAQASHA